jgi:hypothetical protein
MDIEWAALGMPLEPEVDLVQPLEAAVLVKGFDADGNLSYWCASTKGLTSIEILGMCVWGAGVALSADS